MPYRRDQFSNGNYYHVFNKTIDHKKPFTNLGLCDHFLQAVQYYRGSDLQISFSRAKKLPKSRRILIEQHIQKEINFRVRIVAYCLMPNHFHFVLKQEQEKGVENFIANLINSFTRFYNTIYDRKGPLFLHRFHSVPIMSDTQLLYVSRYVHLNPLSGRLVSSFIQLRQYQWSSYKDYLNQNLSRLTQIDSLFTFFKNDKRLFQDYVENELNHEQTQQYVHETEYARTVLNRSKFTTLGVTPKVV